MNRPPPADGGGAAGALGGDLVPLLKGDKWTTKASEPVCSPSPCSQVNGGARALLFDVSMETARAAPG